jgi:hypothetical protein
MTLWSRAFIGALIGAVLTLILHPSSRPFLTGAFVSSSNIIESQRNSLPTSFPEVLPDPTDEVAASLWIHVGAEQLALGVKLSKTQLDGLVRLANLYGERDRENAFWPMAAAIFESKAGRREESVGHWLRASKRLTYNDFQSRYLSRLRDQIASSISDNSWQYAYCYRLRSLAFANLVERHAHSLISRLDLKSTEDLEIRFATLVNGGLMRDGSRNLKIMDHGVTIVEVASHPRELQSEPSIRRLLIAHFEFKEALRAAGMVRQASQIDSAYNNNDGWRALTRREDTAEKVANLTLFSALWPNLPGVLVQCALLAAVVGLCGAVLDRLTKQNSLWSSVLAFALAVGISLAVWILTRSPLAFTSTALCCLFVLLTPKNPRAHHPEDLGPLFAFVISVLSMIFLTLTGIMFLTRTLPVQASAEAFDPHLASMVDSGMAAGLSLIIVACLFLFAPLWALAQHIRTLFVLSRGLSGMAASTAIASLILAIAATPICLRLESDNQETFRMLLENEPVYYVRQ